MTRIRLRHFNCDGPYGAALLVVCGLVLALQLFDSAAVHVLRYDRAAIAAGEWWRLLTAHLVHLNFRHATLDLGGLVLLWILFARDLSPWAWGVVFLSAAAAIDCGLWFRNTGVTWYLGLSGVLHGVLAAAVFVRLRRRDFEGWLLAGLLLAKLAYEQIHGALPLSGDMTVIVDAHLYGAVGGLAAAVMLGPSRLATGWRPDGRGRPCRSAEPAEPQEVDQADQDDGAKKGGDHGARAEESPTRSSPQNRREQPSCH